MTTLKTSEQLAQELRRSYESDSMEFDFPVLEIPVRDLVTTTTEDRATIAAVLKERLEGAKRCAHTWVHTSYECTKCGIDEGFTSGDIDFNRAIDLAIAIIDEVLTSEAKPE